VAQARRLFCHEPLATNDPSPTFRLDNPDEGVDFPFSPRFLASFLLAYVFILFFVSCLTAFLVPVYRLPLPFLFRFVGCAAVVGFLLFFLLIFFSFLIPLVFITVEVAYQPRRMRFSYCFCSFFFLFPFISSHVEPSFLLLPVRCHYLILV